MNNYINITNFNNETLNQSIFYMQVQKICLKYWEF